MFWVYHQATVWSRRQSVQSLSFVKNTSQVATRLCHVSVLGIEAAIPIDTEATSRSKCRRETNKESKVINLKVHEMRHMQPTLIRNVK